MNTKTATTPIFDMSAIDKIVTNSVNIMRKLIDRPKTLCEVLEDNLTDEEFANICKYITVSESYLPCESILAALLTFNWNATKEGRMYWTKIYGRFAD